MKSFWILSLVSITFADTDGIVWSSLPRETLVMRKSDTYFTVMSTDAYRIRRCNMHGQTQSCRLLAGTRYQVPQYQSNSEVWQAPAGWKREECIPCVGVRLKKLLIIPDGHILLLWAFVLLVYDSVFIIYIILQIWILFHNIEKWILYSCFLLVQITQVFSW